MTSKKIGRPSSYKKDIAAEICARLVEGESLKSICRDPLMPDIKTVYLWMAQNEEFLHQYARAKEDQADTMQEEILDIADTEPVQVVDDKGIARIDSGHVNWMRLRIDSRKWIAAKLKPKKYGDRQILAGDSDNPVEIKADLAVFDTMLQTVELGRQAKGK
jgi:hypothetical protein